MVVSQMENTGAGARLEEDQENSLDLLNEECLLDIKMEMCKGSGYISLGWRRECWLERYTWELSAYL